MTDEKANAPKNASRAEIEAMIDEMIAESFPASDPPSWTLLARLYESAKRDEETESPVECTREIDRAAELN